MFRLFRLIKQKFPFIWDFIQTINGLIITVLYRHKIENSIIVAFNKIENNDFIYRKVERSDLSKLIELIQQQPHGFDAFFKPHGFDEFTLNKIFKNKSFLMLGAFDGDKIIGYFFIRYFANKSSFRGKIVDINYQGKGIAKKMGIIMTEISLGAGFRLFATISKQNLSSIASSKAVNKINVIKDLKDGYLLVEYFQK